MRRDHARALADVDRDLMRLGRSPVTRALVTYRTRAFLRGVRRSVKRITTSDVRAYLAKRHKAGIALATQAGELSHIRMFFTALQRLGVVEDNPTDGLHVPRPRPKPHRLVSEDDVERLFTAASDRSYSGKQYFVGVAKRDGIAPDKIPRFIDACAKRDRAAFELLYGLGLRSAEVRAAQVLDLDLSQGTLLVRRAKRGQPERLPLPPASIPHLRSWLEARPLLARGRDEGRLFVRNNGTPYRLPAHVNKLVQRVAKRAQVSVHPHALRRGVATHLVRAGAPITVVQQLLGHAELTTTAIYVEVERADLRRAVDTLDHEEHIPSE